MTTKNPVAASRIDYFMPTWQFREVHSLRVAAPREAVLAAMSEVTWAETPVARFWLRFTPNEIAGGTRVLDQFAAEGQTVLDATEDEYVYGGISSRDGQPLGPDRPMSEVFRDFDEPGYTKVAFNLAYADGVVSTQTRILATDPRTRAGFARYWFLIRIPSGMIRKDLLRAVVRRALAG